MNFFSVCGFQVVVDFVFVGIIVDFDGGCGAGDYGDASVHNGLSVEVLGGFNSGAGLRVG